MTRRVIYSVALLVFLAGWYTATSYPLFHYLLTAVTASALTLTSIVLPRWISWDSQTVWTIKSPPLSRSLRTLLTNPHQASGARVHYTYGLHKRCSSFTHGCTYFPEDEDCHGGDRYFCSMWRSVGFLMSFAVVMEGMTFAAFVVLVSSGQQKRQAGWKIMSAMVLFAGLIQCASMSLIVGIRCCVEIGAEGLTRCYRHTFTITTTAFSRAGDWILRGSCARSAGVRWS